MATLADLADPAALARLRAAAGAEDAPPADAPAAPDQPDTDGDVELKADESGALERKAELPGTQVLSTDEETGVVEALVSVTGIEDRVKDVIMPGAYTKTMAAREPIGVWSHDDKTWVARTEDAVELMPGDPFFKGLTLPNGEPWPAEAGAVKVRARFNLETPHGKAAFSDVKFFEGKTSWSIGYRATKHTRNPRTGVRHIKELDWFEYSPVMVGAAAQAMTLSVKSLAQPVDADDPTGIVSQELLDTLGADELARYQELKAGLELETKAGVLDDAEPLAGEELDAFLAEAKGLLELIDDGEPAGDEDLEAKASRASLDRSPRENWVERAGGLPPYVREIARAIERDNPAMTLSRAIPIAIGRIKKWARGGGDVTAATRAKAAAALAAWEALKAKNAVKYDSDMLAELERKAGMPDFIKDKIAAREGGDDDSDDPKRKPHAYVGEGGLCKKCMAPRGAKVHTDTANDEKVVALVESYKTLGDVLQRAGVLPSYEPAGDLDFDSDPDLGPDPDPEVKGLSLEELQRAEELRAAVDADELAGLFARRDALSLEGKADKPQGYATVAERLAAARGFDEGLAKGKGEAGKGGGAKKGRRVRTAAGQARYGVPIGEFYTKEKGEGDVKRGESGPRTKAAQKALVAAGLLDPKDGTDGDAEDSFFGPKTEAALKKWQKANGLEVTGVLDEETERMLVKAKLRPDSDGGGVPAAARSLPKVAGGGVKVEGASDAQIEALRAAGWKGRPGDGVEAMYPPAKAKPKAAPKRGGGDAAAEAIRAKLAAMPPEEREALRARAEQVMEALAAL